MIQNQLFLLGGHDLEMLTISSVLKENNLLIIDHSLQWNNAYLSQYETEIKQYGNLSTWKIYGIELQEDIEIPNNYIRIDHHNDFSQNPSALEQIMLMLNQPLNRLHQLIAANDAYYIPGMQRMGATLAEIEHIRYEDRKAQGVTLEEEEISEKAIQENNEICGDLIIVQAYSSRFSPICDRLYPYKKLLIYTNEELIYYGKGVSKLVAKYRNAVLNKKMFHGGGESGYLGTIKGAFSQEEIKQIVNQIKIIPL